ncbi:hypothetical protein PQ472_00160 [Lacticaseibacillus pabuli]|uniref:Uncharacterized protein n=2 Tax=Lacticaseibacillus TaxID=2759736 RepID=A0ABY7WUN7_9LACO|nr:MULTISPECIES: hypothetical protein [Lacticaseibacillus]WDF82687.1 hypothetical protein PQ472_00160 [Lacticaseibacillus sp. KACC 23028]
MTQHNYNRISKQSTNKVIQTLETVTRLLYGSQDSNASSANVLVKQAIADLKKHATTDWADDERWD